MPIPVLEKTQPQLFSTVSMLTIAFVVSQTPFHRQECTSLVRPLLMLNRCETGRLCQLWGIPIYPDRSNQELLFSRNRVRKQLLPMVRSFFNPQADAVFSNLSEFLLLERLYAEFLHRKLSRRTKDWGALQPMHPIQRLGEAKDAAWQPSLRLCDSLARAKDGSRHKVVAKGVAREGIYRAAGDRLLVSSSIRLHQDKSPLDTWVRGFEPLLLLITKDLVEQLEQRCGGGKKCGLPTRVENKTMLPPSLKERGRKVLRTRVITRSGEIRPQRGSRATRHQVCGTAFKGFYKDGNYRQCFTTKKSFLCGSIASTPACWHSRHQYFYFPKAGGLITSCVAGNPS